MKKNQTQKSQIHRLLLILPLLALTIVSCSKDDSNGGDTNAREVFETNYFNVMNQDFTDARLPESNSQTLQITTLDGNPSVLAGGSNLVSLNAEGSPAQIIIGVQGQEGYFTMPYSMGRNAVANSLQLLIGQGASESFVATFAVSDGQGNYSEYENLDLSLVSAGTGKLQVSLTWDQLNDVDLHLIEPNGEEVYFANGLSANGGQLDVDSNAACNIDEINNENITYADDPSVIIENGEYEVLVDLWSNCSIPDNTNYSVVVYYDGVLIATTEGTNPSSGFYEPDDSEPLVSVMKFNITDGVSPRPTNDSNENRTRPVKVLSPEKM